MSLYRCNSSRGGGGVIVVVVVMEWVGFCVVSEDRFNDVETEEVGNSTMVVPSSVFTLDSVSSVDPFVVVLPFVFLVGDRFFGRFRTCLKLCLIFSNATVLSTSIYRVWFLDDDDDVVSPSTILMNRPPCSLTLRNTHSAITVFSLRIVVLVYSSFRSRHKLRYFLLPTFSLGPAPRPAHWKPLCVGRE